MTALFEEPPADRYDVVVAGSGAAALMAAAVAAERGLSVLVAERSGWFAAGQHDPDQGNGPGAMHVVFNQRFLDRFGFITRRSGQPVPGWLSCRDSVRELAEALPVDPERLAVIVARFNAGAVVGADPDFARGADRYDRYGGDAANPWPNPCLAPLDQPPFYGMPLQAGNVSAHPICAGYPGAGGTLGPGLTMGYLAGLSVGAGTDGRQAPVSMSRSQ